MSGAELSADQARMNLYAIMRQDVPFQEKADQALELGRAYLGVENGHLTRIDEETDFWESIASTDDTDGEFPAGLKLDLQTTYCRRTVRQDSPVRLTDAPNQGWADDPAFEMHDLHCYHGTTLVVDGEIYGTVCFVSNDPRAAPFSDAETMFVELISRMLEYELEQSRHQAELTRRANVINVLDRVLRHNLRNDLNVIHGHVHLLADRLETVPPNVDVIYRKIEDLVGLSNTARELDTILNREFTPEDIDVASLGRYVLDTVSRDFPDTSFELTGKRDITLRAAPSLERAITELVENAAKYSPRGTSVTLSLEREPNRVRISVEDEGPGLSESEQEVLRGSTETPLVHGSGLGLWLVYRIVTAHDGEIIVDVSDEGTRITLAIPRPTAGLAVDDSGVQTEFQQVSDRFHSVFDEAFDSMVIVDDDRRIMDANDSVATLVGREQQGLIGRRVDDFVVEQDAFEERWNELRETGRALGTISIYGHDDRILTVEYTASRDIVPGQHLIIIRDITERLEREAELRATRQRLDLALDVTDTGVFEWSVGSDTLVWSAELEQMVGLSPGEFEGTYEAFTRRTHHDDLPAVEASIEAAIEHGRQYSVEFRLQHEDEGHIWVEARGKRIDAGDAPKLVGIVMEISDRKEREKELRETKEQLESVVQASPDPIIMTNTGGGIQHWNDAAEAVFGYEREAVLGRELPEIGIIPPGEEEVFTERLERALSGERISGVELTRRTKDGDRIPLRLTTAPLHDSEGTVTGVVAICEVTSIGGSEDEH